MVRLTINSLDGAIQLITFIDENPYFSAKDIDGLSRIMELKVGDLILLALKCQWVELQKEYYILTERGQEILAYKKNHNIVFREMLWDYVTFVKPSWCSRIPFGRQEAFIFMSMDEQACFYVAKLMEKNPTIEVALWWNKLSLEIRKRRDEKLLQIGLTGEKETLRYEYERTGKEPEWLSVDSNLVGFDICSRLSRENSCELFIEVKASTETISNAYFFISENEWRVAISGIEYKFYIWLFEKDKKSLAILLPEDIKYHIPENKEDGRWENVKIPYRSFTTLFQQIV